MDTPITLLDEARPVPVPATAGRARYAVEPVEEDARAKDPV